MKQIIKNTKDQIISVAHIREYVIRENTYDEGFDLMGIYTNGDEVFIDSFSSKEEASEMLETICGEVYELSHEPQVDAPEFNEDDRFKKLLDEEPQGVSEADIPDGVLENGNNETVYASGMPYNELIEEISKEEDGEDEE